MGPDIPGEVSCGEGASWEKRERWRAWRTLLRSLLCRGVEEGGGSWRHGWPHRNILLQVMIIVQAQSCECRATLWCEGEAVFLKENRWGAQVLE